MGLIFIFIDGVGIGSVNGNNPFVDADPEILRLWEGARIERTGFRCKSIDPLLGIGGLPQSATGQTTIFTGINVPRLLGEHKGSFPNREMRKIIRGENLFLKLEKSGKTARFINAYPHHSELFSHPHVNIDKEGNLSFSDQFPVKYQRRISVTSSMMISNRVKPLDMEDILNKRSIYQDFSNKSLLRYGLDLPVYSPVEAADILFNSSRGTDLLLYEFFQSDIYGHRKKKEDQVNLISELDLLLKTLTSLMDIREDTLLVTSDHGNLENSVSRAHSLNPVPLITWGKGSRELSEQISDLTGITPAIIQFLDS